MPGHPEEDILEILEEKVNCDNARKKKERAEARRRKKKELKKKERDERMKDQEERSIQRSQISSNLASRMSESYIEK